LVALIFLIVGRFDEVVEISLGPLKARMRETIEEAAATLDQLRGVGVAVSRVVVTDLMAGSFIGGMDNERRFQLHDEVMKSLDDIGASPEQKAAVEAEWRKGVSIIYERAIGHTLEEQRGNILSNERYDELARGFNALRDFEIWRAATPEEIESFFKGKGYAPSEKANSWLADYRHYLRTGEIRNRSEFLEQ
jgi:hypothetical protein